ncbi:MAG: 4Fe-4S dicluster domain-containing protein [Ferrimicrobium sp.]
MITITQECTGCGACIATCPTGALKASPGKVAYTEDRCHSHYDCIEICPVGAVSIVSSKTEQPSTTVASE